MKREEPSSPSPAATTHYYRGKTYATVVCCEVIAAGASKEPTRPSLTTCKLHRAGLLLPCENASNFPVRDVRNMAPQTITLCVIALNWSFHISLFISEDSCSLFLSAVSVPAPGTLFSEWIYMAEGLSFMSQTNESPVEKWQIFSLFDDQEKPRDLS